MLLTNKTAAVSGSDSFTMNGYIFGGCAISADGTNTVTVTVSLSDSSAEVIFHMATKTPQMIAIPISAKGNQALNYSVSGTNGLAVFYEWTV